MIELAAITIIKITEGLSLHRRLGERVWELFLFICSTESQILIDRHIDQIIICTVYITCKVNYVANLTFSDIIKQYLLLITH